jgi:transcriptional regulator with XRE-family HTH domain
MAPKHRHRRAVNDSFARSGLLLKLGGAVRRARAARKMSLSALAQKTKLPKSLISEIERNRTNVRLDTLWRLTQALEIDISEALHPGDDAFLSIDVRPISCLASGDGKMKLLGLGGGPSHSWFQLLGAPGSELVVAPQLTTVESYSVLSGQLDIVIGARVAHVSAGSTVRCRADQARVLRARGEAVTHAVLMRVAA